MSNEKEIWMETTHGRKSKCKTEFKAVLNKVLVSTLILTTVIGTTTPAFAASVPQSNNYFSAGYTQEYGVSVESAISNIQNTINSINAMKQKGSVSSATLQTLANQLYSLESAVKTSGGSVSAEVKTLIANAEESVKGLSNASEVKVALAVVKANLGIDSVTIQNKNATIKGFDDMDGHKWALENVMICVEKGAISGTRTPDANGIGSFKPSDNVTVGQFLAVITRLVASDHIEEIANPVHWAEANYYAAIDTGIIRSSDWECTAEDLNAPITREDMAYILVKAAAVNGENMSVDYRAKDFIKDFDKVDGYRETHVLQAYSNGLIAGYDTGNFGPKDPMTRAQMATVVCRLMNYVPRGEVNFDTPKVEVSDYYTLDGENIRASYCEQFYLDFFKTAKFTNVNGNLGFSATAPTLPSAIKDQQFTISVTAYDKNDNYMDSFVVQVQAGQTTNAVLGGVDRWGDPNTIAVKDISYVDMRVRLAKGAVAMRSISTWGNELLLAYDDNVGNKAVTFDTSILYSILK